MIVSWTMINSFSEPFELIKASFNNLKPGETMRISAPHRDMAAAEFVTYFHVLPDRNEPPNTFSMREMIQNSLNQICPEVDKDYEELNFASAGDLDVAQGFYKILDLSIEEGYIHATIKKI